MEKGGLREKKKKLIFCSSFCAYHAGYDMFLPNRTDRKQVSLILLLQHTSAGIECSITELQFDSAKYYCFAVVIKHL